jgi:hypothetical protein
LRTAIKTAAMRRIKEIVWRRDMATRRRPAANMTSCWLHNTTDMRIAKKGHEGDTTRSKGRYVQRTDEACVRVCARCVRCVRCVRWLSTVVKCVSAAKSPLLICPLAIIVPSSMTPKSRPVTAKVRERRLRRSYGDLHHSLYVLGVDVIAVRLFMIAISFPCRPA